MERPTYLYKYQPFNPVTLANLVRQSLWFASPSQFNDPLDCGLYVVDEDIGPEEAERVFDHFHRRVRDGDGFASSYRPDGKLSDAFVTEYRRGGRGVLNDFIKDQRGIACFASEPDNPLMWAHYSDGHRGFCLEFDASAPPFSEAKPVCYAEAAPKLRSEQLVAEEPPEELWAATLFTKSRHWSYEKEWRLLAPVPRTVCRYPAELLTGVYFGAVMPSVNREILARLLHDTPTRLHEVELDPGTFRIQAREARPAPDG